MFISSITSFINKDHINPPGYNEHCNLHRYYACHNVNDHTKQGIMERCLFILMVLRFIVPEISSTGMLVCHISQNLTAVPERSYNKDFDVSGRIEHLKITSNGITEIQGCAFGNYPKLRYLFFEGNHVNKVSSAAFNGTEISALHLNDNELSCIPDLSVLMDSLKHLDVSRNQLYLCVKGPLYLGKFEQLYSIHLCQNKLVHLSTTTILWNAPNLRYVILVNNELKQFPNFLHILPKLHTFNLGRNPIECSCEIKWLKQINSDGLTMRCKMFGPGFRWGDATSGDLDKHCQLITTWTSVITAGKFYLLWFTEQITHTE